MISAASPTEASLGGLTAQPSPDSTEDQATTEAAGSSRIPLAVWLLTVAALLWIPLKIISYGYLPPDDALRHAGKAVSQRDWSEILVLREGFELDHNPGWHWLLARVHGATGASADTLVLVSVISLFCAALIAPALWMRRPEAWVAALLVAQIAFPAAQLRVLLGRPFAFTIAVLLTVLLLWRDRPEKPSRGLLLGTTLLLALSAWIHGSWYLFGLVIAAFVLAGQRQAAKWLTLCWAAGTILGALCTGHPIAFLWQALRIVQNALGGDVLQRMLVSEFWPSDGNVVAVFAVAILLFWRYVAGQWTWTCLNNPIFILAVLGWILGLRINRFYSDWGIPALLLWVALELAEHIKRLLPEDAPRRLLVTAAMSVSLVFALTADNAGRWTHALAIEHLSAEDPEMAAWLPEKGGILYAADMGVFYQTFYKNPHAPWRYILGFEPTFMPHDDLLIYRNIQRNFGAHKAFQPWVEKMRPEDRLAIRGASTTAPAIEGLDWHYTARDLWLGKKLESGMSNATAVAAPATDTPLARR